MIQTVKITTHWDIFPTWTAQVPATYIGSNTYEVVVPRDFFPHDRVGLTSWIEVRQISATEAKVYQAKVR